MKEIKKIEKIKDIVSSGSGKLVCKWKLKTGFFGGIDEETETYISGLKKLVDDAAYISLIKFDDDYILMDLEEFTKKLKKGIELTTKLKDYPDSSRDTILRTIINTKVFAENNSSIKFEVFYKSSFFGK